MTKTVEVTLAAGEDAITVEDAKQYLGWEEVAGKDKPYLFRDVLGNKVALKNNPNNRPFRMVLAKRYMFEMLRKKWYLNGETIIRDEKERITSGQHRLVGLVLAEQTRQRNPKHWKEAHGLSGSVTMEGIIVDGISSHREVADTNDLGQKRSLGDVVYRRHEFKGENMKDATKMANVLSGAIRLVWLRVGGQKVSDAPHFPHSEALEFLENHPKIKDAVAFVCKEDGEGAEGRRISGLMSLAYAGGMLYLMATAKTKENATEPSVSLFDKACEFWTLFASGAELKTDHPVLTLRNVLNRANKNSGSGKGRDILCGMIAKAWNAFVDGKKLDSKAIKVKETLDKESGKRIIAEDDFPRIGGLDVIREAPEPVTPETVEGWKVGQKVWVFDEDNGHWIGKITSFSDDGSEAEVLAKSDGDTYSVAVSDIRDKRPPKAVKEEGEDEEEAEEAA